MTRNSRVFGPSLHVMLLTYANRSQARDQPKPVRDQDIKENILSLPIMKTAIEDVGMRLTANIVVLGVIDKYVKQIDSENLKNAIKERVPEDTVELNLKAFEYGQKLVK